VKCACKKWCGDVPEEDDHPDAICKVLPREPKRPLVEVELVAKDDLR